MEQKKPQSYNRKQSGMFYGSRCRCCTHRQRHNYVHRNTDKQTAKSHFQLTITVRFALRLISRKGKRMHSCVFNSIEDRASMTCVIWCGSGMMPGCLLCLSQRSSTCFELVLVCFIYNFIQLEQWLSNNKCN